MWVLIALLLLATPSWAQEAVSLTDIKSIDLPYTPDQKVVVSEFADTYFDDTKFFRKESDVTISDFLVKSDAEQDKFISDWAVKKRSELIKLQSDLTNQLVDVQNQITQIDKALRDWGK